MADIELVIKIPEEMYTQIIDENSIDTMLIPYTDIIKKGTPLPKGHGDLIDRNSILCDDCICPCGHANECFKLLAPTIIEADKERSDKE